MESCPWREDAEQAVIIRLASKTLLAMKIGVY